MWKLSRKLALLILSNLFFVSPAKTQTLYFNNYLPNLAFEKNEFFSDNSQAKISSGCVHIDGRCQFIIAASPNELQQRINIIESRLRDITKIYFQENNLDLEVSVRQIENLKDIYVTVGEREFRLMTVTNWDAEIDGTDLASKAELIKLALPDNIKKAKEERQPKFLIRQAIVAIAIVLLILLIQVLLSRWQRRLQQSRDRLMANDAVQNEPIYTQLTNRQKINLQEVQYRLLQLVNTIIWLGGILLILGLFPYTRFLQVLMISLLKIPVRLGIVGSITYVSIRLSYALIDQFSSAIVNNLALSPFSNQRLQLRVTTIASIVSSIITITGVGIGILFALSLVGINIGPVLAGLGIFSLALSLGSQNLIKDAINGFFIILEDQFAVGDMIKVAEVSGLVENVNLRITQIRDAEGRLITIPNSEIKIVANLSSQWARADLNIPIAYQTDVDGALELITQVAVDMSEDGDWRQKIIGPPDILGVDNFGDRGLIIKVWIKTQPLQQWAVAREFRRRLKVAFDRAGIPIPHPQQEIWFNRNDKIK
jgi:small conductance mechanosensitive channel